MSDTPICWRPSQPAASQLGSFISDRVAEGVSLPAADHPEAYSALHAWSIAERGAFWDAVRRIAIPRPDRPADAAVVNCDVMAPPQLGGARWFPGLRFNFAAEVLAGIAEGDALICWDERGPGERWSRARFSREVARAAAALRAAGIGPGDRVAGWLPNIPHTMIAMLASAAVGAIWTSCSPDFGVDGIVDRFGQTAPRLLIFADGYRYGGKTHDCLARARSLVDRLPSVERWVMVPWVGGDVAADGDPFCTWEDFVGDDDPALVTEPLPFDHPLLILYSSGTTGLPKCIVHGAGGTLLQHVKEHRLQLDLRRGDRLFYYTTCGWMMWNWLLSGLASGATLVLYDGAAMPSAEPDLLWRMAEVERVSVFGTSAKYLALAEKLELRPRRPGRALTALRQVLSTGSPLAPESFDWLSRQLPGVQPVSISGGTDIVSCFVLGNPLQPVHRGEIQGAGLGMAVEVWDADGQQLPPGEAGELVCTAAFPSMPVSFWGDSDGARYHAAYFDRWPGVWCHGDWIVAASSGGYRITGRSDATLNPGGVRIGTAEIYRAVEALEDVVEALVIGQRIPGSAEGDVRIVLFVRLRDGSRLDPELTERIRLNIRQRASPHHVPRVILAVRDLPRTRSGKLSELAVRDVVEGREVTNVAALANPEALADFRDRPELALPT